MRKGSPFSTPRLSAKHAWWIIWHYVSVLWNGVAVLVCSVCFSGNADCKAVRLFCVSVLMFLQMCFCSAFMAVCSAALTTCCIPQKFIYKQICWKDWSFLKIICFYFSRTKMLKGTSYLFWHSVILKKVREIHLLILLSKMRTLLPLTFPQKS